MPSSISGDDGFVTSAGGIVLQTRYAVFKGTKLMQTVQMQPVTIDELTVNITPKSIYSVFKIELAVPHESSASVGGENTVFSVERNGVYIRPPNCGNRVAGISPRVINFPNENETTLDFASFVYVDEPATTDTLVYKAAFIAEQPAHTIAINRTIDDIDQSSRERCISTLIVTELSPVYD